ncbi:MAG: YlbF family regulator [Halovenus sp.]
MSVDSDTTTDAEQDIEALAREFGEALAELPEYDTFLETKAAVEADKQAQEQIAEFERVREEYLAARQRGQATHEDLREMQDAQEALHDIPAMSEYLQAQNELELRLQALNEHLSEPLEIDFGDLASGCCED